MSMCGTGTGKVEIQDPYTGLAVNSYEAITGPPCLESLGAMPSTGTITSGTWTSGCSSTNRAGRYGRFYSFTLSQSTAVTITLESTQDAYLYLLRGAVTNSPVEASNDDISNSYVYGINRNSRVTRTLAAGTYTAEATTYRPARTGNFTIRFQTGNLTGPPVRAGITVSRTLNVGDSTRVDDISGQFTGVVDRYTASSSDISIATASIPASSSTMTITGVAAGTATITVTATNTAGTATQTYPVTVTTAPTTPTAGGPTIPAGGPSVNAGRDQTVSTGATVSLIGTGSPVNDDDDASYSWTQQGTTTVNLTYSTGIPYSSGLAGNSARFTAPSTTGTLVFRLTVTDHGTGISSWDELVITVS